MRRKVKAIHFRHYLVPGLIGGIVQRHYKGVMNARSLDPISHLLFVMIALLLFKVLMILQDGVLKILAL